MQCCFFIHYGNDLDSCSPGKSPLVGDILRCFRLWGHDYDERDGALDGCVDLRTPVLSCMEPVIIYPRLEACLPDFVNQDLGKITVLVFVRDEYVLWHTLFLCK